jgi:hypothetical protein
MECYRGQTNSVCKNGGQYRSFGNKNEKNSNTTELGKIRTHTISPPLPDVFIDMTDAQRIQVGIRRNRFAPTMINTKP